MSFSALLQRIQRGVSTVELVHTSHPRWPLPPGSFSSPTVQISVLDSSFNPPTLAHLALANTLPPTSSPVDTLSVAHPHHFHAQLLLLSVRNVDKQLKLGDATFEQRVEMMVLLAQDLAHTLARNVPAALESASSASPLGPAAHELNVAVAIIDEPTFVGKSTLLLDFLRKRVSELSSSSTIVLPSQTAPPPSPKLTFLMGTDTIVRLFASRYYRDEQAMAAALHHFFSPTENDSHVICARRVSRDALAADLEAETKVPAIVASNDRISFVDIGDRECAYSSSEVRERIRNEDEGWRFMVTSRIADYVAKHRLYIP